MYAEVQSTMRKMIQEARYIALTVDEVTTVDNGSWVSVHCYVVVDWVRIPLLIGLHHVEVAPNDVNLTKILMASVAFGGGVDSNSICSRLVCFGADGAGVMQGCHKGVSTQIQSLILLERRSLVHKMNEDLDKNLTAEPCLELLLDLYMKHTLLPKQHLSNTD